MRFSVRLQSRMIGRIGVMFPCCLLIEMVRNLAAPGDHSSNGQCNYRDPLGPHESAPAAHVGRFCISDNEQTMVSRQIVLMVV